MPVSSVPATSRGPAIREVSDKIGVLLYTRGPDSKIHVLMEHVTVAENDVRRWKLPQGDLPARSTRPGHDSRQLLFNRFKIKPSQTGILEVTMSPIKDPLPESESKRKGFHNAFVTWVSVRYYDGIMDELTTQLAYSWIPIDRVLEVCQSFKVESYSEVLELLADVTNGQTH